MTEKLFITDPYMKEFKAIVKKVGDGFVILDKTCFYPQSGGQVGDTGYLDEVKIIDTKYDDARKSIVHYVDLSSNFEEGQEVDGKLDWDRRYKIMRLHAASHIMEHFLFKIFGNMKLLGSHVNEKYDMSTYECSEIYDPKNLKKVEDCVNEYISQGFEIRRFADPQKADWYYWEAGEIKIPCGGTHPKNVKEIGTVCIKRKTGGQGKEKIKTSVI